MAAKLFLNLPNGRKMPAIGLGTFQTTDEQAIETALNLGYRHIDSAYVYENEAIIGNVLKKWLDSGKIKREELFVTTKLPMFAVHQDRVAKYIRKSLANLQLDYVDLYLVHFPVGCKLKSEEAGPEFNDNGELALEPVTDHTAIWKEMEKLVDQGLAKYIGLSNFNIKQIEKVLKSARIKPAVLQVELHVYLQQHELVDYCQKHGINVTAYSPLGSPSYNVYMKKMHLKEKVLPDMLNDPVVKKIAKKQKKQPSHIMLRFNLQRGIAAIPQSTDESFLKENINVFDFSLDSDDMKALYDLDKGEKTRICDFDVYPGLEKHPEFPFKS